ncbi:MAG: hypothetical protein PHO10_00205 [Gemmiger sp.]|nr:hypothetical protein [Gemmiger sp.]
MKLLLSTLLLLLAAGQGLTCRHSTPWRQAGFWLVDALVVGGCAAGFFAAAPLSFGFLASPAFWGNLAAICIATGLLLLLAPLPPATPPDAGAAPKTPGPHKKRRPRPDPAALSTLLGLLNFSLCIGGGAGGVLCLAGAARGYLPPTAWYWLMGYCLLWLLPLALRQLGGVLCWLRTPPGTQATTPTPRRYTRL